LLQAAKENKSVCSFRPQVGREKEPDDVPDPHLDALLLEIKYYLKLNRFGRRVLDTRNVSRSLWPAILFPMQSKDNDDPDALFFFIREYFMRISYPLRHQQQQQQQAEQHRPHGSHHGQHSKRAKVYDGNVSSRAKGA
jgi:hypothetical protein